MADGTTKRIDEIEVGDEVLAADPETGEVGSRIVTATWPHDDWLIDLELEDGSSIRTTEDHHFWNQTDQAWQESQHLDEGDLLLAADGGTIAVDGLDPAGWRWEPAFDLTVADLHSYFVVSESGEDVLVHNQDDLTSDAARREAMRQAGIPISQQPIEIIDSPAGRQYVYEIPKLGGGSERWIVTQQLMDRNHGPHWDAGRSKPGTVRDPSGRYRPYGGGKVSVHYAC